MAVLFKYFHKTWTILLEYIYISMICDPSKYDWFLENCKRNPRTTIDDCTLENMPLNDSYYILSCNLEV